MQRRNDREGVPYRAEDTALGPGNRFADRDAGERPHSSRTFLDPEIDTVESGMRGAGIGVLVAFVLVVAAGVANFTRSVPAISNRILLARDVKVGSSGTLPWPAGAEGALGVAGIGILAQTSSQTAQPTASVAKVMTALVVLKRMPLAPGQQGPTLTITSADVAEYQSELAQDESTVAVVGGEQLSEYQALEGMLLPGGNNMAVLLATWAFGSLAAGVAAMNQEASSLGMTGTHFADSSGFSPLTVSTPTDLVRLGEAAMRVPALADIVKQRSAVLPVVGQVQNIDTVIGQAGIVGIKTGSGEDQQGAFLFAAPVTVAGTAAKTIVGVVLGVSSVGTALSSAPVLIQAATRQLQVRTMVRAGEEVGRLEVPWAEPVAIRARAAVTLVVWQGQTVKQGITLRHLRTPIRERQQVGTVTLQAGNEIVTAPLVAGAPIERASWPWRATRRPPFVPNRDWPL